MKNNLSVETRRSLQVLLGLVGAPITFVMIWVTSADSARDIWVSVAGAGGVLSIFGGVAWWRHFHRRPRNEPPDESAAWVLSVGAGAALVGSRLSPVGLLLVYLVMFFVSITMVVAATLTLRDSRQRGLRP